jgi:hypothetical protein
VGNGIIREDFSRDPLLFSGGKWNRVKNGQNRPFSGPPYIFLTGRKFEVNRKITHFKALVDGKCANSLPHFLSPSPVSSFITCV